MSREYLSKIIEKKLRKWFVMTLDTNNKGLVCWKDFENAIENMVSLEEANRNSRLKVLRKRIEQNFQKYFWDLCAVGDANNDGNIDLDEWLDVMNNIVKTLKETSNFPEWYEGLHRAIFRSVEFLDHRSVTKAEFSEILAIWNVEEDKAEKAFDYITENGTIKMDYTLFSEFMKKFILCETQGHPINLGCDR